MELEMIAFIEISQMYKDKYCIFSVILGPRSYIYIYVHL